MVSNLSSFDFRIFSTFITLVIYRSSQAYLVIFSQKLKELFTKHHCIDIRVVFTTINLHFERCKNNSNVNAMMCNDAMQL